MTKAQEKTLNEIKREIPRFDFYGAPDMYEIKEWEESELENGVLMVSFITGMKDDEGTLAACLCRKYRVFWIGVRGGVRVLNKNYRFANTTVFDLMNKHYRD